MKIDKLQIDALKSMLKGKRVLHCTMKDGSIAIGEGTFLGFVPKEKMLLRFNSEEAISLKDMFDPDKLDRDYELARQQYIQEVERDFKKVKLGKYKTESGKVAWINIDKLKYFEKDADLYVKDRKSPLLIFESGIFVGVVLPVNRREEDD